MRLCGSSDRTLPPHSIDSSTNTGRTEMDPEPEQCGGIAQPVDEPGGEGAHRVHAVGDDAGKPAARATSSSWCSGFWSPDASAYALTSSRVTSREDDGRSRPTSRSSNRTLTRRPGRSACDRPDATSAPRLVPDLGAKDHEAHPALVANALDRRGRGQGLPHHDRSRPSVLLFPVQHAGQVDPERVDRRPRGRALPRSRARSRSWAARPAPVARRRRRTLARVIRRPRTARAGTCSPRRRGLAPRRNPTFGRHPCGAHGRLPADRFTRRRHTANVPTVRGHSKSSALRENDRASFRDSGPRGPYDRRAHGR